MSGPPLSGQSPAQAAGSSVTGSSLSQPLIQRRQQRTYELRLCTPVILSRPAPQPAADGSAVAQHTTAVFTELVCAPELTGDTPVTPHSVRPIDSTRKCRAPSRSIVCAQLTGHVSPVLVGTARPLETGADLPLGTRGEYQPCSCGQPPGAHGSSQSPIRRARSSAWVRWG
jgi:hypothetical protein